MMEFKSAYTAKQADTLGYVSYTETEHKVWHTLYERQMVLLQGRACNEFLKGLSLLNLTPSAIPQLPDVNQSLKNITGWQVVPVPALITATEFFNLLAHKKFPAATFIRNENSLEYVTEPDIFHELFGHCPMLTEPAFADFVQNYGKTVLTFPEKEWPLLQRLFWFTVEFGLIQTAAGLRIYGGGILSSLKEVVYSVEDAIPMRKKFDVLEALRTPYRIDRLQTVYFVLRHFDELYDVLNSDLANRIATAHELGEHAPTFPVEDSPTVHINAC